MRPAAGWAAETILAPPSALPPGNINVMNRLHETGKAFIPQRQNL
jgi:hypothetical protein